jgi:hypothetical protein
MGECAPEVVDELGLPDGADVVKDSTRLRGEFVIGEQSYSGHVELRFKAAA